MLGMHPHIRSVLACEGLICCKDHPRLISAITRAARNGELVRVFPGVYLEPGDVTTSRRLTTLCAWQSNGVLHGPTAAAIWTHQPVSSPLDVAVPGRQRPQSGVSFTIRTIPGEHVLLYRGLRIVSPSYCAAEAAATDQGERAFHFFRERLTNPEDVAAAAGAFKGTPGNQERKRVVKGLMSNPWSVAERKFHDLLRRARIDGWVANAPIRVAGRTLLPDALFADQRLIVEIDGFDFHHSPADFQADRERQNLLTSAGYRVLRFTWLDLTTNSAGIIGQLRGCLAAQNVHHV